MLTPDIVWGIFLGKFFINILDAAFYMSVAIILFSLKPKIKQLILPSVIIGFIFASCFAMSIYLDPTMLSNILLIIAPLGASVLLMKHILKISFRKALSAAITAFIIQTLTAVPLPFICELFNIDINKAGLNPIYMFLLNFASLMLDLPFLYVINRVKNILIKKKYYPLILLIILINLAVVVLNIALIDLFAFKYNLERDLSIYIFSMILILVSAVSSVIISRRISKLRAREQELENMVFYNQILMKTINDLKRIKHNHSNIISSVYCLVKAKDWSKLEEFMNDLVSHESRMYSQELISLTSINNGAVLGILDSKLEKARELDVQLIINVYGEINEINMPISQFCEVLGILLDNAVEAAADSAEKYVKLTIAGEGKINSFRIENSCKDKPDISKMFQKDWSTKGEGRGLGLRIVNNIKRKHKNLILNTFVDDNYVLQELIVG